MKKIVNVYHKNCLDGTASACAVFEYATQNKYELIQVAMAHNYTDADMTSLFEELEVVDEIYFTDFTMKYEDMTQMMKIIPTNSKVYVFDHHKGVEETLIDLNEGFGNFEYKFDNNKSGAVLTWEHFWSGSIPKMIYNIQDRDLWKFELEDTDMITSYLFESVNNIMEFNFNLYKSDEAKLVGGILCNKREKTINDIYDKFVDKYVILKCKLLPSIKVFNSYEYKSELGNKFSKIANEPVGIFHIEGDKVGISMRSCDGQKHTANEYAKQFGGNGHKNASGCWIDLKYFMENIKK